MAVPFAGSRRSTSASNVRPRMPVRRQWRSGAAPAKTSTRRRCAQTTTVRTRGQSRQEYQPVAVLPCLSVRCRSCCCGPFQATNASGWVRSFGSSRSAWNTSPRLWKQTGHAVTIADLRFGRSVDHYIRTLRPALVGIAGMHALETDNVLDLAANVRRASPDVPIVIGGHTAAAYPAPFLVGRRHGRRDRRRRARHAACGRRARAAARR